MGEGYCAESRGQRVRDDGRWETASLGRRKRERYRGHGVEGIQIDGRWETASLGCGMKL